MIHRGAQGLDAIHQFFRAAEAHARLDRPRAQSQFSPASTNVPDATASPPKSIRVASAAAKANATTLKSRPPGKRNPSATGRFRRRTGSAAAMQA